VQGLLCIVLKAGRIYDGEKSTYEIKNHETTFSNTYSGRRSAGLFNFLVDPFARLCRIKKAPGWGLFVGWVIF